ncbi:MAG: hypothetical protein D3924_14770 [Candidatus Electrothrix sp. AR4]|nr:hypothetical protein [Candidatus Electrothrix sp. AR4]
MSNSSTENIEWDFDQVPCKYEESHKFGGIILLVIAVFLFIRPGYSEIKSIIEGEFVFDSFRLIVGILEVLFYVVAGTCFFLGGLGWFSTHTVTEFDGETFRYRSGSEAWDAPLSEYEGVLARSEYHASRSSSGTGSYTLYIVELMHPDEQRRITLRQSGNFLGHHARWETYSRQLGLPALKQDGEGYTQRDVEDPNKSVHELADFTPVIHFYRRENWINPVRAWPPALRSACATQHL